MVVPSVPAVRFSVSTGTASPNPSPPDREAETSVESAGTGNTRRTSLTLVSGSPLAVVGTVSGDVTTVIQTNDQDLGPPDPVVQ